MDILKRLEPTPENEDLHRRIGTRLGTRIVVVPYEVNLRDTRNGNTKTLSGESKFLESPDEHGDEYYESLVDSVWTNGNDECDCNRSRYMYGRENGPKVANAMVLDCNMGDNKIVLDKLIINGKEYPTE